MKNYIYRAILLVFAVFSILSCKKSVNDNTTETEINYVEENYTKTETTITMRDGIKLFTTIYSPKNKSVTYPIL